MSTPPSGLPTAQDRQSAPLFPGHAELLQAIPSPHSSTTGTISQRSLPTQSQGLSPHHLDAQTPQGLHRVQGKSVMCHSSETPQSICTTCTCHRCLHIRHVATTRPEHLTDPRLLPQETQLLHETNSCITTFNPTVDTKPQPQDHLLCYHCPLLHAPDATFPCSLQKLSNHVRRGGGGPPTLEACVTV